MSREVHDRLDRIEAKLDRLIEHVLPQVGGFKVHVRWIWAALGCVATVLGWLTAAMLK